MSTTTLKEDVVSLLRTSGYVTNGQAWELADAIMEVFDERMRKAVEQERESG